MNAKIVTFGEVMMRLTPPGYAKLSQATSFDILYAGAEANVAAALSGWGLHAAHVTCFPDHELGYAARNHLQQYGVEMAFTKFREGRLGVYFNEQGSSLRSPRIVYDRFDSAFANLEASDFDWDKILEGANWFHWSGITPAISASAAAACLEGAQVARKKGIQISGDINYRRNLWQYGKSAVEVMPALIELCDIVVAGTTDFENCLGITAGELETTCERVVKKYPSIKTVITTRRDTITASRNKISGWHWRSTGVKTSREYDLEPLVDRIGAGDAFMAGYIYAALNKWDDQQAIDFATAACALKHTVEGDVNLVSVEEVKGLLAGENVGKLLR